MPKKKRLIFLKYSISIRYFFPLFGKNEVTLPKKRTSEQSVNFECSDNSEYCKTAD